MTKRETNKATVKAEKGEKMVRKTVLVKINQPATRIGRKNSENLLCLEKSVVLKIYQGRDQNRETKMVRKMSSCGVRKKGPC